MAMQKFASIADYDASRTPEAQAALETVRALIADLVPDATDREERFSYDLPTLFVRGKRIVHYAGWAEHLALYPVPESPPDDPTLREDLTPYIKGKGTLHFPYAVLFGEGSPSALISRVISAHLTRALG